MLAACVSFERFSGVSTGPTTPGPGLSLVALFLIVVLGCQGPRLLAPLGCTLIRATTRPGARQRALTTNSPFRRRVCYGYLVEGALLAHFNVDVTFARFTQPCTVFNDFWSFDVVRGQWRWLSGTSTINDLGSLGLVGQFVRFEWCRCH